MTRQCDQRNITSGQTRDRLLSLPETLDVVGISRSTAYRLLAQGLMPAPIKIGALNFFSELELQAWISQKLEARNETNSHA